ncbi:MAG TPA: cupredoxin family copper-binding protein [Gemmatimonadales bacterium]
MRPTGRGVLLALALLASLPAAGAAQSLLDRSPNLAAGWIPGAGVLQFNFLHRFSRSPAPDRKITSFPAFVLAAGLPARLALGLTYATNSAIVAGYPNEWEFFLRGAVLTEARGAPVDLSAQAGYNLATESVDGEVAVARDFGRTRVIGVARGIGETLGSDMDFAAGGGAAVRLTRHVAVAGDAVALLGSLDGEERVAWSAGLHLMIPSSPHTLSLHVSNAAAGTLQGATRAGGDTRFGFEFTIPVTLARYFGGGRAEGPATPLAGDTVRVSIANLRFTPDVIEIAPGTTVVWTNTDPIEHTVTAMDGSFDSGLIRTGASWSHTFTRADSAGYACRPHPVMKGRVAVAVRGER